ncbi:MAG: hypothetical protein K5989_12875 [Lachnospiraceae bacterium]|nr:hypothetical protein [Lachnospiraceae bacterium]
MNIEEKIKELENNSNSQQKMLESISSDIKEVMWANVYHDTVRGCPWFPEGGLPCWPGRGAVGYQYMYVAFRILNELQPTSILEIGMGQSTRLIGQFIKTRNYDKDYRHYCIEHDANWSEICKQQFPLDEERSEVIVLPLTTMSFTDEKGNSRDTIIYDGFFDALNGKKFQLISVDGPYGFNDPLYSRIDILEIIPQCLSNDFCILIDDYDRPGERRMTEALMFKLKEAGVEHEGGVYVGKKQMAIITSPSWAFLRLM